MQYPGDHLYKVVLYKYFSNFLQLEEALIGDGCCVTREAGWLNGAKFSFYAKAVCYAAGVDMPLVDALRFKHRPKPCIQEFDIDFFCYCTDRRGSTDCHPEHLMGAGSVPSSAGAFATRMLGAFARSSAR